ncbi:MAG: hypothetical protein FWE80_05610 [Oscillospiraceae bacterium]|nr:hypothetical protein [Oscillospiraceae bacterium]
MYLKCQDTHISSHPLITELMRKLEYFDPPLLDRAKAAAVRDFDGEEHYIRVTLPHIEDAETELWAAVYTEECVVYFGHSHMHFSGEEWVMEAASFIIDVLGGCYEIHTVFRGNRLHKVMTFLVDQNGNREFLFSMLFLNLRFFWKRRVEVEHISYFRY